MAGTGAWTVTGQHVREHTSVLAAQEKRLLVWMAERIPRPINSDHLTALGALAMVATAAAGMPSRLVIASTKVPLS